MKIAGAITDRRRHEIEMYVSIDTIGEGAGVFSRCVENERRENSHYIISCKYSEGAKGFNGKKPRTTCRVTDAGRQAFALYVESLREYLNI